MALESEWPDGSRALRFHYAQHLPQFVLFCLDAGLSRTSLARRIDRAVGLGASPPRYVVSSADMCAGVHNTPLALGYVFGANYCGNTPIRR